MRRCSFAGTGVRPGLRGIAAIGALALVAASPAPGRDLEAELAVLDRLDAVRFGLELRDQPLVRVLDEIQARCEIPVAGDWRALDGLGLDERTPATIVVRDVSAFVAMQALAIQLGDELGRPTVEISAGRLVLTSRDAAASMRWTDVYDVRDLLADAGVAEQVRSSAPPPAVAPEGEDAEPDRELVPEDVPPPAPPTPGVALLQVLLEHVDPEAWMRYGGTQARIDEREGVLLVSAPPTTHRALRDALLRLRRANPSCLEFAAAIVELPRAERAALERRAGGAGDRLARLLLAPDADAADSVRWRTTGIVAMDAHFAATADGAGGGATLALEPVFDAGRGVVTLGIELAQSSNDEQRRVRTTVDLAGERSGFVLELPAAEAGESVRVLAVTTARR